MMFFCVFVVCLASLGRVNRDVGAAVSTCLRKPCVFLKTYVHVSQNSKSCWAVASHMLTLYIAVNVHHVCISFDYD